MEGETGDNGTEAAAETRDELGRLFQIPRVTFPDRRRQDVERQQWPAAGDLF